MFVTAVIRNLEGERDYGEHTLATPTLQRLHVLCGRVNIVLARVKVQGAKSMFLKEKQTSCLYIHQKHSFAQPEKYRLCISLFCEDQDRIPYK